MGLHIEEAYFLTYWGLERSCPVKKDKLVIWKCYSWWSSAIYRVMKPKVDVEMYSGMCFNYMSTAWWSLGHIYSICVHMITVWISMNSRKEHTDWLIDWLINRLIGRSVNKKQSKESRLACVCFNIEMNLYQRFVQLEWTKNGLFWIGITNRRIFVVHMVKTEFWKHDFMETMVLFTSWNDFMEEKGKKIQ